MAPLLLTSVLDGGPQSRSGRSGEEKNLAIPVIEPGPSSLYLVAIPTELSRIPY
jgi:hypothetical protein